jgi:hypothetical protein
MDIIYANDGLESIFLFAVYFDVKSIAVLSQTCKRFKGIIDTRQYLWKVAFEKRIGDANNFIRLPEQNKINWKAEFYKLFTTRCVLMGYDPHLLKEPKLNSFGEHTIVLHKDMSMIQFKNLIRKIITTRINYSHIHLITPCEKSKPWDVSENIIESLYTNYNGPCLTGYVRSLDGQNIVDRWIDAQDRYIHAKQMNEKLLESPITKFNMCFGKRYIYFTCNFDHWMDKIK